MGIIKVVVWYSLWQVLINRAYQILRKEIKKFSQKDDLEKLTQKMLLEDLEKRHNSSDTPATLAEIKLLVSATYPKFSGKVILEAAKANKLLGILERIRLVVLGLIGVGVLLVGGCGAIGLAIIMASSDNSESVASKDATSLSTEEHFDKATVPIEKSENLVPSPS